MWITLLEQAKTLSIEDRRQLIEALWTSIRTDAIQDALTPEELLLVADSRETDFSDGWRDGMRRGSRRA